MRRSALIVAPLLALGLLAGCDQGNNNDNPGDGGDTDATSDGKDSNRGDGLESCIVGDWEADADTLATMGLDELSELGTDMSVDIVFTFEKGGDFDWAFAIAGSGEEQGMAMSMDMDLSLIGTWKVSGSDQVNLTLDDATGTMTVEAGGQKQSQDITGDDLDLDVANADDATMTVTCSASALKMTDDSSETISLTRK